MLPRQTLTDELLRSLLMEIENIVNSRSLTYISIEEEADEILTPNHFLLASSNGLKSLVKSQDDMSNLRRCWQSAQKLLNAFWKRWTREYLPTIANRSKWHFNSSNILEGDIVIIVDDKKPRNIWIKGRVLTAVKGRYGQVRKAIIHTRFGIYERPATKLLLMKDLSLHRTYNSYYHFQGFWKKDSFASCP